ncbi:MAG: hypothetical protein R3E39_22750 [Anaerolineae bacterium]
MPPKWRAGSSRAAAALAHYGGGNTGAWRCNDTSAVVGSLMSAAAATKKTAAMAVKIETWDRDSRWDMFFS